MTAPECTCPFRWTTHYRTCPLYNEPEPEFVVRTGSEFAAVQPPAPAVAVPAPCLDVTGAGGNGETRGAR